MSETIKIKDYEEFSNGKGERRRFLKHGEKKSKGDQSVKYALYGIGLIILEEVVRNNGELILQLLNLK
jgi:hypothetical protein